MVSRPALRRFLLLLAIGILGLSILWLALATMLVPTIGGATGIARGIVLLALA